MHGHGGRSVPQRFAVALGGVALAVVGCGTGTAHRADAAATAVERFSAALASGDTAAACALLAAPTRRELQRSAERPCAEALGEENLPAVGTVRRTAVYGGHAEVWGAGDTVFLTDRGGTWQIVAAGCRPRRDAPYECALEG